MKEEGNDKKGQNEGRKEHQGDGDDRKEEGEGKKKAVRLKKLNSLKRGRRRDRVIISTVEDLVKNPIKNSTLKSTVKMFGSAHGVFCLSAI